MGKKISRVIFYYLMAECRYEKEEPQVISLESVITWGVVPPAGLEPATKGL